MDETVFVETVFVRVRSHRAADRLKRLLGDLDWHYTMRDGGELVRIPAAQLEAARAIPGVTKARPKGEPRKCWPW